MKSHRRMSWTLSLFIVVGLGAVCLVPKARAQAYCSLRNPTEAIQVSFPDFDHYRSVVRRVGPEHREGVRQSLPFTIHENELGTHTLYIIYDSESRMIGVIHVRTERGSWGLNEIVWVFDSDMRVQRIGFQRSRDNNRQYIESEAFQEQIRGKAFSELHGLINEDGSDITPRLIDIPDEARSLVTSIIRSALKTLSVTQLVWLDSLAPSPLHEQIGKPYRKVLETHEEDGVPRPGLDGTE